MQQLGEVQSEEKHVLNVWFTRPTTGTRIGGHLGALTVKFG